MFMTADRIEIVELDEVPSFQQIVEFSDLEAPCWELKETHSHFPTGRSHYPFIFPFPFLSLNNTEAKATLSSFAYFRLTFRPQAHR